MARHFGGGGRRPVITGLGAAFIAFGSRGVLAQAGNAGAPRALRLMTSGYTLTIAVILDMLAEKLDQAHGISIEPIFAGGASSIMIDAVLSGSAEFGGPGTLTGLQAIRQGADIKIIAAVSNNQLTGVISNAALKKANLPPSASIADRVRAIKGSIIGVNPVGSNYYQMARAFLKQNGLDPDTDVRLLPIADPSAQISSIRQGRVDAIIGASGVVEQAVVLGAGTIWFSGARGDMPGAENVPVSLIVARSDMIEKRRADVDAFRAALTDALDHLHRDPAATGRTLKERYFTSLSPEVWNLAWTSVAPHYPSSLAFSRTAFGYWIANDPKGAPSYKDVDYDRVVYGPAQAP